MIIVSITPDIALDVGYTYAGGLGVLEGDKFYAAAKLGLEYVVISILYKNGYISYDFDEDNNPIPLPQPQPKEFIESLILEDEFEVKLRGERVQVRAWTYKLNKARAVFLESISPEWARKLIDRLYIEDSIESKFYKYTLLAKAAASYIRRNLDVERVKYIDLQEAYTAMLPLTLRIPGKYRLIIHTPGPWGHPTFPKRLLEKEYGYKFISSQVVLTEIGLATAREGITVSAKHFDIMGEVLPHFAEKMRYVTNGINIDRWMDPRVRTRVDEGKLDIDDLIEIRRELRHSLAKFLTSMKSMSDVEDSFILGWCRRVVAYKRPDFVIKLIDDLRDLKITYILGGKAHPYDGEGLRFMKVFRKMHKERDNVIYIHEYTVDKAKLILKGIDLLLFTPFPGWEASGTSFMKAGINGVPTLASRDGAAIEFIIDDVNGWLFGEDLRELIDYHIDPKAEEINEKEYEEFKKKVEYIYDMKENDPEKYYQVSLNVLRTLAPRVGIERTLKEYYPDILRGIVV
mgnify:FL=1